MLVTFISQCEKNALKRTRRVLDAFANRIGDNVWQTAITEEGLDTVKKLLKATASRSTAVSCHRVKTRHRTELVWVVGNKRKFNEVGGVAVNRTKRNILHTEWENNWQYASSIQIIATISALLHDIGKSTIGFQTKLKNISLMGDPYRHEWISLKLFELIIADCTSDEAWLNHMVNLKEWLATHDIPKQLQSTHTETSIIETLPPLAQWVAWLIVTHHRLPPDGKVFLTQKNITKRKINTPRYIAVSLNKIYKRLEPFDYWVKNPKTLNDAASTQLASFWQCEHLVIHSPAWQSNLKRWANKALKDSSLMHISQTATTNQQAISDTFLLHVSRLCLVIGDHNYSSLAVDDKRCLKASPAWRNKLIANTDRKTGKTKQALDEHLLGVASFAAKFARFLPALTHRLPTIKQHNPLAKHTGVARFKWQNKAFDLAKKAQKDSEEHGFFGVNMASTGCGKTIGNARIMYALADPKKGARFTIALGLRVLTLQTGLSFRKDLTLTDEQLAILVGGTANKKLFEYNQAHEEIVNENTTHLKALTSFGSESSRPLLDEHIDSGINDIDYRDYDDLNIDTIINDHKARQLLFSPIVTCTVDHIIQASECKRGGGFIVPMLRLLSSDLILDEPDDFNQDDLPALCRLVHLAGVYGSRVLLSSATLTPDMVSGLYQAYLAGRTIYNQSQQKGKPNVVCAWFDEQPKTINPIQCADKASFEEAHQTFIGKRNGYLNKQPIRRKAEIIDITAPYNSEQKNDFYQQISQQLLDNAVILHNRYHECLNDKKMSVGLVRIANIKHIIPIVQQFFSIKDDVSELIVPDDTHIHIACYHSRQLLVLRNYVEKRLDKILKRTEDEPELMFQHQDIQSALTKSTAKQHLFIVIGSPVTEVGRDHDYDWAIVEPSSMRSIIQLAGRVWRHRPNKTLVNAEANIMLMKHNFRYLTQKNGNAVNHAIFTKPGFETDRFKPSSYDLAKLISQAELDCIDAKPRITAYQKSTCQNSINDKGINKKTINNKADEINSLAHLEHIVMKHTLNNSKLNYVNAYWSTTATGHKANTHLQQLSPFRYQPMQEQDWMLVPDEECVEETGCYAYYAEDVFEYGLQKERARNKDIRPLRLALNPIQTSKLTKESNSKSGYISPWLTTSLVKALTELQKHEPDLGINALATRYARVSLQAIDLNNSKSWYFHPFLGFLR